MKEMVGGCCVCSDERGFYENPLVYCDGNGCNVAVHQVSVPTGPWFCRKCESQERQARVKCELCPSKDGALKKTDNNNWAHVVCALYIPEVRFGNNNTMEPIVLQLVPPERYSRTCSLCEEQGKENKAKVGACMQCNKQGCKHYFHVTCAQAAGLLCEEAGNNMDNVKYCGYCSHHYQKLKKEGGNIKPIPAFKPIPNDDATPESSPEKFSPSRQSSGQYSVVNEIKQPKKKTAKTGSISSNASMASPSSIHSNSNNGLQTFRFEPKIKTENITEEAISSTKPSHSSPMIADSSIDKSVIDSTNTKKKKKSNASIASASPPTVSSVSPTPPVISSSNNDNKSGNPSLFASIFSSSLNSSNDTTNSVKITQFSKPNTDFNLSVIKRTKSSNDINYDKKKFKKSSVLMHSTHTPIRTKSASKYYSDSKTFPIKKIRKKKNEINCEDLSNGVFSIPVNHPNMTPLQNGYSTSNFADKSNSWFHTSISQNSYNDSLSSNMLTTEGPLPSNKSNKTTEQNIDVPQTLEQLLERQWAQGSQFIVDQAQHFDIASLLSCLHQLRSENNRLEERVRDLMSRRDQLLAVNSRLAMPANNVFPINGALSSLNSSNIGVGSGGPSASPMSAHSVLSAASSPRTHANSPSDLQNKNLRVSSPGQAVSPSPSRSHSMMGPHTNESLAHNSSQLYSTISQNYSTNCVANSSNAGTHSSPSPSHNFYGLPTHPQNSNYIRKSNGSDKR